MLVGRDAGGPDFRDLRVRDDGEAHVDRARARGVFQIVQLPEGQAEGKHPVLAVHETLPGLPLSQASEGQRRAHRPVKRVDRAHRVPAVGHDVRLPTHLDVLGNELVDDAGAVRARAGEDEDAPLLQLPDDLDRRLGVRSRPEDRGEARHAAIHELDPQGPHDGVSEEPVAVLLGFGPVEIAQGHDHFLGEQRGDPRVQGMAEVREPDRVAGHLVEEALCVLEDGLHVPDLLHLLPQERIDHGKEVRGLGELDLRLLSLLPDCAVEERRALSDDLVCAADGGCCDDLGHALLLSAHQFFDASNDQVTEDRDIFRG